MGESPRPDTVTDTTKRPLHAAVLLVVTALDATWRTLVPGIVGVIGGIVLDHQWHTTPLLTIIGLALGMAVSALLIYRLFKAVQR